MKRQSYTSKFKSQVVLEISKEEKPISQIASENGVHANQLRKWKSKFLREMPEIFETKNQELNKMKANHEKELENLYAEVSKLSTELSWIKENLASTRTRQERIDMVKWADNKLSISKQAELLSLNRSSLYYKPVPPFC